MNLWLIATILVIILAFLVFVVQRVVKAHRGQVSTGSEDLEGKPAEVRTKLSPVGTVFLEGELWKAILDEGSAEPGETVYVTRSKGLTVYVSKSNKGGC